MSAETGTDASASRTGTTSSTSSVNPDSVRAVARKDFRDSIRSWVFWGLSIFFFMLLVATTGIISYFGDDIAAQGQTTTALVGLVQGITSLVIPLIALILGWKSIAGERESGSLKILLSLPHSRKDVLLGKLIGRSTVLSVSLIAGFVLAAIVVAALLGSFSVADYAGLLAVSILYGVAYTSLAVSLSSVTRSTTIAGAAMFGLFVLFYIIWDTVIVALSMLMNAGYLPQNETTAQATLLFNSLSLNSAYQNVLSLVTSMGETSPQTVALLEGMFGSVPFYLQDWFSFIILLAWIVVPIAIALYRFDRVDL
ncbi:ABC transporter permease [Natrialba asiatica]|uniref:ABC transporter n=1 Tax=Natrialba asiatica (strain ATCC 700177 / DSM 12278 / JCM 9576 / FERM P-10747 / NBRC 102637 / 172P1) TaxID=29540 RepID=M0AIZ2_NATA1|nr:ABC transporter permease [Natrialba asiatica]ELY98484.1 ABC transporter [Natrialba asiatica DSM 12278]